MKSQIFHPVIMAGGVGSRLWPLSRQSFPKQFQALLSSNKNLSMLQHICARISDLTMQQGQLICNQDHRFLAADQIRSLQLDYAMDIVLEPCGRNTAPALLIAALRLEAQKTDHPMLVLAADHAITDEEAFQSALYKAHYLATQGWVATLGIVPTFACTGYGYIQQGGALDSGYKVQRFIEKPSLDVACQLFKSSNYYWNSGMFIVRPSVLIAQAQLYCPRLLEQCKMAVSKSTVDLDFVRLPKQVFLQCKNISIDYAIMEPTQKAAVVPVACGWSDVGDLNALKQANEADDNGNVMVGDVEAINTHNSYIHAGDKLVATLGVDNLAIVQTKDALLVANLDQAQQVKDIVAKLQTRAELQHHREVYRPWGSYDSVDVGSNYQVKRITVKPGARLSLQRHQHRAEHWVVVEGIAHVHLDGDVHVLKQNQSIYIPKMAIHNIANKTDKLLHLIEVQSGDYLGEDDIERLEDQYGRANK